MDVQFLQRKTNTYVPRENLSLKLDISFLCASNSKSVVCFIKIDLPYFFFFAIFTGHKTPVRIYETQNNNGVYTVIVIESLLAAVPLSWGLCVGTGNL